MSEDSGTLPRPMPTRIKICGITRPEDGRAAAEAGAHAIGLVFYRPSPRCVDRDTARAIVMALPPFVASIGLFVDAPAEEIRAVLAAVPLTALQFHGHESPPECACYGLPYLKAIRMVPGGDARAQAAAYAQAQAVLLDGYEDGRPGGTGRTFDWRTIPKDLPRPMVLAGGLDADNVQAAIRAARPWAVDVSGGVESAPGIKDEARMALFCQRVREAS